LFSSYVSLTSESRHLIVFPSKIPDGTPVPDAVNLGRHSSTLKFGHFLVSFVAAPTETCQFPSVLALIDVDGKRMRLRAWNDQPRRALQGLVVPEPVIPRAWAIPLRLFGARRSQSAVSLAPLIRVQNVQTPGHFSALKDASGKNESGKGRRI